MPVRFNAPRGTKDILPDEITEWRFIEETFRAWCARYGYREIRTPAFEDLGLFERTAGRNFRHRAKADVCRHSLRVAPSRRR